MNRYARNIISEFSSSENKKYLYTELLTRFNNDIAVKRFLTQNLDNFVNNFTTRIQQEISLSEPLPGTSIVDQINCFNNQFLADRSKFIQTYVIVDDSVPVYSVKDDMPTSRHNIAHHQRNSDDILNSWRGDSGRGFQAREDPSSDVYGAQTHTDVMQTGILFCDQSSVGMQRHHDMFSNNPIRNALNKTPYAHENTAFGVSNPAADARLLSRRTFRRNEAGVENGIMRYEARLYNRHLERDIDEGLRGKERDYILSCHDMTSLHARIDHKNRVRNKYEPCTKKSTMSLNVPEDARYY
jgi:hypothetical protein